jgi:pimeloyl-ACP methyl ester carboxylesterase
MKRPDKAEHVLVYAKQRQPHERRFGDVETALEIGYKKPGQLVVPLVRQEKADGSDVTRCWLQKEPARKLKNLANIPVVVIQSEASYHAPYDHCTVAYLRQAGVRTDFIRLADHGIRGNGHMMMLEKNSDDIARVMDEWIVRRLNTVRDAPKGKKK